MICSPLMSWNREMVSHISSLSIQFVHLLSTKMKCILFRRGYIHKPVHIEGVREVAQCKCVCVRWTVIGRLMVCASFVPIALIHINNSLANCVIDLLQPVLPTSSVTVVACVMYVIMHVKDPYLS